ncbi:MAG: right-handed parallel beta-helix repeat-containing protein [Candidatus Thorarchaeota archaeon]
MPNLDNSWEKTDSKSNLLAQTTYWTETYVFINDSDPIANWNDTMVNNEWCSGSGTFNDPYVINTVLLLQGSNNTNIEIINSRAYFQINNCLFLDCDQGISLNNVSNGIISNNLIIDMSSNFVNIYNCTNITVNYNVMHDICIEGITVSHSTNISIIENVIDTFCLMNYGIDLDYVNYSKVINNSVSFTAGYAKCALYHSNNNLIMNNSLLSTGGSGLILYTSQNNQILNNTIKDCGDAIILYNKSNSNEISHNYLAIRDTGIRLNDNSGLNFIINNIIDTSTIFETGKGNLGIKLYKCTNNTVLLNYITNLGSGIYLSFSNYSFVINNTLLYNGNCIKEYNSIGNEFSNNNCIPIPEENPIIGGYILFILIFISIFGLLIHLRRNLKKIKK